MLFSVLVFLTDCCWVFFGWFVPCAAFPFYLLSHFLSVIFSTQLFLILKQSTAINCVQLICNGLCFLCFHYWVFVVSFFTRRDQLALYWIFHKYSLNLWAQANNCVMKFVRYMNTVAHLLSYLLSYLVTILIITTVMLYKKKCCHIWNRRTCLLFVYSSKNRQIYWLYRLFKK